MARSQSKALTNVTDSDTQNVPSIETQCTRGSGDSEQASPCQSTLKPCTEQSSGLKEHWRKPTTIKELAANINSVASAVLNGTIDLRTAQVYGSLVRVVAQATSLEVTRGRFLKEMPDLNLDLGECDD